MHTINAKNVEDAYMQARKHMEEWGVTESSRNGEVMVVPWPVMTVYGNPTDRVLLNRGRKSNHAFHINEAIWMLSGSNDAHWLDQFIHDFSSRYANPDGTMDGAYGHRWRKHFDCDQLEEVVEILTVANNSRRAVIAMHDPVYDLNVDTLDQPCNTHIYLRVRAGALDMTVMCRSNDIIWGAYGANAVHFSVLLEYLAAAIGVKVGMMYQFSNNWHAYTNVWENSNKNITREDWTGYTPLPLVNNAEGFIADCERWVHPDWEKFVYLNDWFARVLYPIRKSFMAAKNGSYAEAYGIADNIHDFKWRKGMIRWIENKEAK